MADPIAKAKAALASLAVRELKTKEDAFAVAQLLKGLASAFEADDKIKEFFQEVVNAAKKVVGMAGGETTKTKEEVEEASKLQLEFETPEEAQECYEYLKDLGFNVDIQDSKVIVTGKQDEIEAAQAALADIGFEAAE